MKVQLSDHPHSAPRQRPAATGAFLDPFQTPHSGSVWAVTRIVLALVAGAALLVFAAATIGEYPLSAADIWLAAVIVPALIGSIMAAIGRRRRVFWLAAGPMAGASLGWGIGISTTWGIEPVPVDAWFALAFATVWPVGWGLLMFSRSSPADEHQLVGD